MDEATGIEDVLNDFDGDDRIERLATQLLEDRFGEQLLLKANAGIRRSGDLDAAA